MKYLKGYKSKYVFNTIVLKSSSKEIWEEITNVKLERFRFPFHLRLLGIPKPLSAKVMKEGVGGYREAYFSTGSKFEQELLEWEVYKKYRFKFNPSKDFNVGHFMSLSNGPFQILTGGYKLISKGDSTEVILSSKYSINGFLGKMMHIPFRLVVYSFQIYLLRSIRKNLK